MRTKRRNWDGESLDDVILGASLAVLDDMDGDGSTDFVASSMDSDTAAGHVVGFYGSWSGTYDLGDGSTSPDFEIRGLS